MSALEHDERCERDEIITAIDRILVVAVQLGLDKKALEGKWRDGLCACASRALTDSRQREEEAKGEIAREKRQHEVCDADFRHALNVATQERDALLAENDRLTLAASESARTLQVEITRLKAAIEWALGMGDEFPPREPGQGAYWWRTELWRRSGLPKGLPKGLPQDGA